MRTAANNRDLDYPGPEGRGGRVVLWDWTTRALIPLSLAGCIVPVDLRVEGQPGDRSAPPGDADCPEGERVNPATNACEPCVGGEPRDACPCQFVGRPGEFPICEGPEADFTCAPSCEGNIEDCNAYAVIAWQPRVKDCDLLRACCASLQAAGEPSEPCCEPGFSLFCIETGEDPDWPFIPLCLQGYTCCGTDCTDDSDCDTDTQTCQDNRCAPGCDPVLEYCHDDGTTCECRAW